jgi:protein RecA
MARKSQGGVAALVAERVNATMKENVVGLGSDVRYELRRIPTGIRTIDRLLHGGFARGRHSEVYGDWLVGKSLISYSTLALAQARGEVAALVDTEGVFNSKWFRALGGRPDELILAKPKNASKLGNTLRVMIQKGDFAGVDVILIDSVASLLPKEEEEQNLEDSTQPANLARLMSTLLRQLTMQNVDTAFIWTNQWRDKIARIPGLQSTPGGRALGYYASTRLEMAQGEKEMEEVETIHKGAKVKRKRAAGRWVHCTVRKDKTGARPESAASFLLDYETRMPDTARELIDLGMRDGLISRTGDYYELAKAYGTKVRCHGIKRMVTKLTDDEELFEWLDTCISEETALIGEGD